MIVVVFYIQDFARRRGHGRSLPRAGPAPVLAGRPERIGMSDVIGTERSTKYFAAIDAEAGGGLSREAAVGQLKYAADLMQHASYPAPVGERLLAAVADLSGWVGWMSHDVAMEGPAQRYFISTASSATRTPLQP